MYFGNGSTRNYLYMKHCAICGKNAVKEYFSQTSSYYRNRASANYNFCSNGCMEEFDNTRKCRYCSYYEKLVQVPCGFMLCTNSMKRNKMS
ncbi:hypothetical protein PPL_11714 [Heterostelium album PN500]|uniref:MYM-type domain-containing protein n=1 Tax=Heterostelium pallidum (strain ATCC 26659 / Pp 5 / PN500) TaxID=670386 RepID=D3BU95_HETP5|nr:hypothetical protein PPL_11714 [Heterostelium album PN500]EFA75029.1 hypothetical protein PPL_11714 [Heterostelium album PN500]|eukprot:XP_020427163.1 hypothetical protein PPL_11714 [Heterostelium album PN500]